MELSRLRRRTEWSWVIEATGPMRVPVVIFGGEALVSKMDQKAWEQASNVAALPGIQESVFVMPDAHSGTDLRLVGSWPSMQIRTGSFPRGASVSIFRVECAHC